MSASTGIGGLIVGMAMLAVFVMFVGTLDARLSTHLSVTEQDDPPPDVSFVDANLDANGLVEISITTSGSGYSVGDDVLDGTTVVGTVTEVDGSGGLLAVSVAMEGNRDFTSSPTLSISSVGGTSGAVAAVTGSVVHANVTNVGSTVLALDDIWTFLDGENVEHLPDLTVAEPIGNNLYSGETMWVMWLEGSSTAWERIAISVGETTVVTELV
jgi:archaellum component FlaF (FlaF/FlaG flagellin family)